MFISPAWAQGQGAGGGGLDILIQILPFILIFVIFYFLLIRPEQQRRAQLRAMIAAVRRGDVVVTGGGIVGKVKTVHEPDDEVTIEIAKGVEVRVVRSTILDVRSKTEPAVKAVEGKDGKPAKGESKGGDAKTGAGKDTTDRAADQPGGEDSERT